MSQRRISFLRAGVIVLTVGAVSVLAGCGSSDDQTSTIAPVVVDINEIDGTTIDVSEGNVIDLTGDDDTYLDWTADIADSSIVEFTPGKDDGSAQFNPGLSALEVGQTEVTLDNSSTDDVVTFTVQVTAPAN